MMSSGDVDQRLDPFFAVRRISHVLWLSTTLVFALCVNGLKARLLKWPPERVNALSARLLRLTLESLGGPFIKLGQVLAMRPDFLPGEYVSELTELLDDVPPFATEEAIRVIERDLGSRVDKLFGQFPARPTASASFGQVYKARLSTGESVAVKVQRPNIARLVRVDLRMMRVLIILVDASTLLGRLKLKPVYQDFQAWTRKELDYQIEARNAHQIHVNAQSYPEQVVPRVHWSHTTSHVLTMEFLEGAWVKDILSSIQRGDEEELARYAAIGINLEEAAENILRVFLRQVFDGGLFHADPHAANIAILDGNRVGLVDFGIVGTMDDDFRWNMFRLLQAMGSGSSSRAFEAVVRILEPPPDVNLRNFKNEYQMHLRAWLSVVCDPRATMEEKSAARLLLGNLDIMRRHGLDLPPVVVMFYRALIILDSILLQLCPRMNLTVQLRGILSQLARDQVLATLTRDRYFDAMIGYQALFLESPPWMSEVAQLRLLSEVLDGSRKLDVEDRRARLGRRRGYTTILRLGSDAALLGCLVVLYLRVATEARVIRASSVGYRLNWEIALVTLAIASVTLRWAARAVRART